MRHVVDRSCFCSFACLPDCLENTLILRVTGCRFPNPVIDVDDVISGLRHHIAQVSGWYRQPSTYRLGGNWHQDQPWGSGIDSECINRDGHIPNKWRDFPCMISIGMHFKMKELWPRSSYFFFKTECFIAFIIFWRWIENYLP